ncbi:peptidoglycan-binding protein [Angustibacter luteus]|uniref:Peptidoglycan-binding protein n=1 Tax=Angustibacter luteus TaxID=658456 RepID=A0ABW1JHR9_9ACTN
MSSPHQLLAIARAELGAHELPPGSNVTKYGKAYGLSPAPWCAQFACAWVWKRADLPIPRDADSPSHGWASVQHFLNSGHRHGWVLPGGRTAHARPGDYVCFEWDKDVWADHVGIVVAVSPAGRLTTIEGNSAGPRGYDAVAYHHRSRRSVAAFVRPPYTQHGTSPASDTPKHMAHSSSGKRRTAAHPVLPRGVVLMDGSPHHDLVAVYQHRMLQRGWTPIGRVDGVFGRRTEAVTRAFQKRMRLDVDGQVGTETWTAAFATKPASKAA